MYINKIPFIFIGLLFVTTIFLTLTSCSDRKSVEKDSIIGENYRFGSKLEYEQNKQALLQFIQSKLTGEDGSIYTNYVDTEQIDQNATGYEVLSESLGLLLRYYARTGQEEQFELTWNNLNRLFNMESGFSYRYSPKLTKKYTVNAAVDDLRVIRALYEASEQLNNDQYKQLAEELGARFLAFNSNGEQLYDFYDEAFHVHNNFITLCYIDLRTLTLLNGQNKHNKLIASMTTLLQEGYLSDDFPFYETRYHYEQSEYQSEDINTIESLLTILSLAEMNKHQTASIDFIKRQVELGELYGRYSREGKPLTDVQSTAIYAITAMIGAVIEDLQLYETSISRMEQYQIQQTEHELFGAYGNIDTLQVYSFDNLQALLAYTY